MTPKYSIGFVEYFYVFVLKLGALSNTRVLSSFMFANFHKYCNKFKTQYFFL